MNDDRCERVVEAAAEDRRKKNIPSKEASCQEEHVAICRGRLQKSGQEKQQRKKFQ